MENKVSTENILNDCNDKVNGDEPYEATFGTSMDYSQLNQRNHRLNQPFTKVIPKKFDFDEKMRPLRTLSENH